MFLGMDAHLLRSQFKPPSQSLLIDAQEGLIMDDDSFNYDQALLARLNALKKSSVSLQQSEYARKPPNGSMIDPYPVLLHLRRQVQHRPGISKSVSRSSALADHPPQSSTSKLHLTLPNLMAAPLHLHQRLKNYSPMSL